MAVRDGLQAGAGQWALVNKLGQPDIPKTKPLWEMHYIHDEEFETAQILLRVNHG